MPTIMPKTINFLKYNTLLGDQNTKSLLTQDILFPIGIDKSFIKLILYVAIVC